MKTKIQTVLLLLSMLVFSFCSLSQYDSALDLEKDTSSFQSDTLIKLKKNTIFAEVGGNGFIYSINYDRLIDLTTKFKLSTRIGVHYTHYVPFQHYKTFCVPVEVSGLYAICKQKHFIELGTGISYMSLYDQFANRQSDMFILALRAGYRFQQPKGGLFVKVGFVPIYDFVDINPDPNAPIHTWFFSGGLGLGYTF
jgi:hypothetical protein